jgi:4'-phosphopantetheinyl transferase EntD
MNQLSHERKAAHGSMQRASRIRGTGLDAQPTLQADNAHETEAKRAGSLVPSSKGSTPQ